MRFLLVLITGAALAQQTPQIPDDVTAEMNVEYSRVGERMAMDIVRPKTKGPHPAVVAIHGGGFRAGQRTSYLPLCIRLAQRGYVAATVSYRLAPRHQFPAAVEDVKAAVRFLRGNAKRYDIDPMYIGATGGSAGGHLALMLGLTGPMRIFEGSGGHLDQSSAVQAVVNYYGPTDFTESYGKSVDAAQVLPMFLGGDLLHNRKAHIAASPLYYVTPQAAPILTVHGTRDAYVNYEQAAWLTSKLVSAEVETELETISGAGHGFKGPDAERAEARLFGWFDKHLKPAPQTRILISDHGPKGEVVAMLWPSGRELWTRPNDRGHDVQPLANGNVLYTIGASHKVAEFNPQTGQEVWSCCQGLDHPLAAQRLGSGNTLIGDARAGRVIEVDPDGKQVWEYKSEDIQNMRMRNSHRTAAGTTLIAVEAVAKIIEVDSGGRIVWAWQAPEKDKRRLYMGRRLANGNTAVSLSDPGEIVEVDAAGKVVRSIGGAKMDLRFGWASGFDTLPNGNLLISDYTGRRLVEVDGGGRLVNELRLGPRTVASVAVVR
ncbi:MAG: alpha/beta hydrolase fold domain-containing protein [Bryobacteraceae bacterium]|nr:alpha/beta hydrolase fold domain-containing protein [Bryobacteraceae bacterium]